MYHHGAPQPAWNSFLNCQTIKHSFRCSGVKICEYLDEDLLNLSHTHADERLFNMMLRFRNLHVRDLEFGPRQVDTFAWGTNS